MRLGVSVRVGVEVRDLVPGVAGISFGAGAGFPCSGTGGFSSAGFVGAGGGSGGSVSVSATSVLVFGVWCW